MEAGSVHLGSLLETLDTRISTFAAGKAKMEPKEEKSEIWRHVVIMDPTAPRGSWPLGRVLEAFHDKKGFVRSVRLQTKSSVIERPVTKLCLLHENEG